MPLVSSLLCSVCLHITHELVALWGAGHYAGIGEQIAAWQPGRAGKEVNTTTHAFTNIFFLWDGKELFSKSLPM